MRTGYVDLNRTFISFDADAALERTAPLFLSTTRVQMRFSGSSAWNSAGSFSPSDDYGSGGFQYLQQIVVEPGHRRLHPWQIESCSDPTLPAFFKCDSPGKLAPSPAFTGEGAQDLPLLGNLRLLLHLPFEVAAQHRQIGQPQLDLAAALRADDVEALFGVLHL